jgi:hypothetical protein
MSDYRKKRIHELIIRVNQLPNEIIVDSDYPTNGVGTEEAEKKYYLKRQKVYSELDAILIELRSYIKVYFGKDSEYFRVIHQINFTSERQSGFIMNTFNVHHNEYWLKGINELRHLLQNIEKEIELIVEIEKKQTKTVKEQILRLALFLSLFGLSVMIIWNGNNVLGLFFQAEKINAVKIILSTAMLPTTLVILIPKKWLTLIGLFVGLLGVSFALLQ